MDAPRKKTRGGVLSGLKAFGLKQQGNVDENSLPGMRLFSQEIKQNLHMPRNALFRVIVQKHISRHQTMTAHCMTNDSHCL